MMNHASVDQSNLDEMGQRRPTLVEEGVYRVRFVDWAKRWLFRRPMLVMRFQIVDEGENWGKELYAYYRVEWRGDQIKAGQIIGTLQDIGKSKKGMQNHLHLTIRKGSTKGPEIDPTPWLKAWGAAGSKK